MSNETWRERFEDQCASLLPGFGAICCCLSLMFLFLVGTEPHPMIALVLAVIGVGAFYITRQLNRKFLALSKKSDFKQLLDDSSSNNNNTGGSQ